MQDRGLGVLVALALALVLITAGCGSDEAEEPAASDDTGPAAELPAGDAETKDEGAADAGTPPGTVRFVHISDLHVGGPPEDLSFGHIEKAFASLNEIDFEADFLVATGDLVDFMPEGVDASVPGALHKAKELLDGLKWPWRPVAGNHEYYKDDQLQPVDDKAARDAYIEAVLGAPLDYSFVVNGVRLVVMSSMAGDRWANSAGLVGSHTDEQLDWLRAELARGEPAILFMHHPPTAGELTPTGDSLCAAIEETGDRVKAVFAGHLHGFWSSQACGVPYYLVSSVEPGRPFYFLVEYDAAADALSIVNAADIDFGTIPEHDCDPATATAADPGAMVGSVQLLRAGSMVSNLPGLEGFDGEGVDRRLPIAFSFDAWDEDAKKLSARLTFGSNEEGFVANLDNAPCLPLEISLDGPCAVSEDLELELDVMPILEAALDIEAEEGWQARITVKSIWFEGRIGGEAGAPVVEEGVLHLVGSGETALDDLKTVVATEYCAGRIEGCAPGSEEKLPACDGAPDAAFFDRIPARCDVKVGGYPVRSLLLIAGGFRLENLSITGEMRTERRETSATAGVGLVDEALFSTEAGANCAP